MAADSFPAEVISSFNQLVSVESAQIDRRTREEMSSAIAKASQHGTVRSSRTMLEVTRIAGDTIPARAQMAFNQCSDASAYGAWHCG